MPTIAVSATQALPASATPAVASAAAPLRYGPSHATLTLADGKPQPLTFAVGAAGDHLQGVRVVIKDEAGMTVASFALSALSGTQNVIWTPRQGASAGGYAAYWEGSRLSIEAG
jgi:hypothetical protein